MAHRGGEGVGSARRSRHVAQGKDGVAAEESDGMRTFSAALAMAVMAGTLAACAGAPETSPLPPTAPGSSGPAAEAAPTSPLPNGAPETLPPGVWTTRVGGGVVEAVISDGDANIGISCPAPRTVALRYRPVGAAADANLTLSARSSTVGFPAEAVGDGNLRAELPAGGLFGPVLAAVERGAPLEVTGVGRAARFSPIGARRALESALRPNGCR